jgi:hypothetical protein
MARIALLWTVQRGDPSTPVTTSNPEDVKNHRPRVRRQLRLKWRVTGRTAAAVSAATALALLAAACGASPSSAGSDGSTNSHLVAFSRCMRANGVPSYPDPDNGGVIPKESDQQLGVTSAQLQAAQSACQHLLPNGGRGPTPAEVQQVKAQGLKFAQCMRHHGVALPDPASTGRIPDPASVGIDQGSPQFEAANQACRKYRPPYMPSNAQYNAYARTHE